MTDELTDETILDWRETDMRWWDVVNRLRVVCNALLMTRGDFERCSDHAATLGIENDERGEALRLMEERHHALREAVNRALSQLCVPIPGHLYPVVNAVEILRKALTEEQPGCDSEQSKDGGGEGGRGSGRPTAEARAVAGGESQEPPPPLPAVTLPTHPNHTCGEILCRACFGTGVANARGDKCGGCKGTGKDTRDGGDE